MLDYITGLWIDQNHSAFKMKIVLVLLTSLTFVVCSRIECDWVLHVGYKKWDYNLATSEYLCGDQCLGMLNTCHCGNDRLTVVQAFDNYCCQEPNTSCEKTRNGDIQCQGQVLLKNQTCHGSCRQNAKYGFTMLPCADQNECYTGILACRGKPQCKE